jgi:flagellar protein FlaG
MDVQAATSVATILPPGSAQVVSPPPAPSPAGTAPAPVSAGAVTAVTGASDPGSSGSSTSNGAGGSTATSNPQIGPTPGLATLPASSSDGSKKTAAPDPTLASGVAKLFNAQEQNVSVSFQVEQNPNEIVTVFTDKQTGKVIVQFPSETLIALAKFFDKLDGNVINKKV